MFPQQDYASHEGAKAVAVGILDVSRVVYVDVSRKMLCPILLYYVCAISYFFSQACAQDSFGFIPWVRAALVLWLLGFETQAKARRTPNEAHAKPKWSPSENPSDVTRRYIERPSGLKAT